MADELAKRLFDAWPLNDRGESWHDLYPREQAAYEDLAAEARAYWRDQLTGFDLLMCLTYPEDCDKSEGPIAPCPRHSRILALLDSRLGGNRG